MAEEFDRKYRPSPEYRFWLFDPEGHGLTFYRTAKERDEAAKVCIDGYLDESWAEETDLICAGEVTHTAQVLNKTMRPPAEELDECGCDGKGNYWDTDVAWRGNYTLEPLPAAPEESEHGD